MGATRVLAEAIVEGQGSEPNPGLQWAVRLLQLDSLQDWQRLLLSNRYLFALLEALSGNVPISASLRVAEAAQQVLEDLCRRAPDSAECARGLSVSYSKLGDLHRALGQMERALDYHQRALAIREDLHRRAPDSAQFARDLVVTLTRLTACHSQLGDFRTADRYARQCRDVLKAMQAAGMPLDPPLRALLDRLSHIG